MLQATSNKPRIHWAKWGKILVRWGGPVLAGILISVSSSKPWWWSTLTDNSSKLAWTYNSYEDGDQAAHWISLPENSPAPSDLYVTIAENRYYNIWLKQTKAGTSYEFVRTAFHSNHPEYTPMPSGDIVPAGFCKAGGAEFCYFKVIKNATK